MTYKPRFPGDRITNEWLYAELQRIAAGIPAQLELASIKEFGAKGNGSHNDTRAIQAALNHATKKIIYFPEGDYPINASLTCSVVGKSLIGFNPASTRILVQQTTGDALTMNGSWARLHGLQFVATGVRTAGYFVKLMGSESTIEDCYLHAFYHGIYTQGAINRIVDTELHSGAVGGTGIFVSGGDTSQVIDNVLMDSPNSANGIYTDDNAALMVANTSILRPTGGCLVMAPGSGQGIFSNKFVNCFFDQGGAAGIRIVPSATAGVYRSQFVNCWTGGPGTYGVEIVAGGASTVDGIDFLCHETYSNTEGFRLVGSNVAHIQLVECRIAGQLGAGLSVNPHVSYVNVSHCHFGAGYGFPNNSFADVYVATSVTAVQIMDCTLNSAVKIDTSSEIVAHGNRGYATKRQGTASFSAAATSVVVSTGMSRTPQPQEIVLSPATGLGAAAYAYPTSISGSTFTINLNAAPGGTVYVNWLVDTDNRNL